MHRNQYLVTKDIPPKILEGLETTEFEGLRIYSHQDLDVESCQGDKVSIALIGYLLDPLQPELDNRQLVEQLVEQYSTRESLFRTAQQFCGRYVLLVKSKDQFFVTGDACHLRQINYAYLEGNPVLTSSLKLFLDMFDEKLQMNLAKQHLIQSKQYKQGHFWYGDDTYDDRFRKLLPNNYLDLSQAVTHRLPLYAEKYDNDREVVKAVAERLRGTYAALIRRYTLKQPLTAGWDSRTLLAASRDVADQIGFYIFDRPDVSRADIVVPTSLSEQLGLGLDVIHPNEVREEFKQLMADEQIQHRVWSTTPNIQYHYDQNYGKEVMNVNGNVTEIARCFYGYTSGKVSASMLCNFSGYKGKSSYICHQIENWAEEADEFANRYQIPLPDLFYWEQKMGNWGAMYPTEQDIAMEQVSPFNNRDILLALLQVHAKRRVAPDYTLFRELAHALWPEVLNEPINPDENQLLLSIKSRPKLRHYALTMRSILRRA